MAATVIGCGATYGESQSQTMNAIDSMAKRYIGDTTHIYVYDNPERKKRPWTAAAETFGINVFVQCFDRFVLDADFAKINFKTIKHNFQHGFVWDNDQFSTNLFAHPYHGGLYFNAARSNGMSF